MPLIANSDHNRILIPLLLQELLSSAFAQISGEARLNLNSNLTNDNPNVNTESMITENHAEAREVKPEIVTTITGFSDESFVQEHKDSIVGEEEKWIIEFEGKGFDSSGIISSEMGQMTLTLMDDNSVTGQGYVISKYDRLGISRPGTNTTFIHLFMTYDPKTQTVKSSQSHPCIINGKQTPHCTSKFYEEIKLIDEAVINVQYSIGDTTSYTKMKLNGPDKKKLYDYFPS